MSESEFVHHECDSKDNSCIYVPLSQGAVALIDSSDRKLLLGPKWYLSSSGYAARNQHLGPNKWSPVYMHSLIHPVPKGMVVDHKNGNKLDNRRENLRSATKAQNSINAGPSRGRSKYKGVSPRGGKWRAYVVIQKRQIYLGAFNSEIEAALAYDRKVLAHYGEYAWLNQTNYPEDFCGRL